MRKKIITVFLLIVSLFVPPAAFAQEDTVEALRGYDGIELPKGTFIQVTSMQEISTAVCDEGTLVKFISTNDLYLYDVDVVPKNTEFFGYVEKINEPVVGTNASLAIKITKMRYSDGFEIPISGCIYSPTGNIIGGELTNPASYIKMPHYQEGLGTGTLQFVPGPARKMGEHTIVAAGADLIIMLLKPAYITHTLTD